MEIVKLKARSRSAKGKGYAVKARTGGWIPAIYYGRNRQTKPIEVEADDFARLVRAKLTNRLIDLGLEGEGGDSVSVIKELQRHVIKTDNFLHIDFQHVSMNEKITVECPVQVKGVPVGVREESGILEHPVRRLTIECLPMDIPDKIVVDVSALHIGDSIHIRDLSVPNVTIKNAADEVVAVVSAPMKEEEVAAPTAEAGAEGAVPAAGEASAAGEGAAPVAGEAKDADKAKAGKEAEKTKAGKDKGKG